MSHSNKLVIFKRGSILAGSVLAVLAVGTYLQTVSRIDPFAGLKETSKSVDPNLGLRIEGVSLYSFEGEKLITSAKLDRMDIGQDRQNYDLYGVRQGTFYSNEGKLEFDAPRALWSVAEHKLQAPQGGHVKGKNADLQVPQFVFDSKSGVMNTPGEVKGKLGDGTVLARAVRYNVNDGSFKTGPIQWSGNLALSLQDTPQGARKWDLKSEGGSYTKGDLMVYEKGWGTDGDIIIFADLIEHNRKTDIVTATGNVRYFSAKANMVCERAVIERKSKKATLTGNVQMLIKAEANQNKVSSEDGIPPYRPVVPDEIARDRPPAPGEQQTEAQKKLDDEIRSGKNMRNYPTICYAEKIEYWYRKGERHAIITGKPQARQELTGGGWRQVWTKTAYYDGEKEKLKLVSASDDSFETRMINSIGDDLVAVWLEVSTREGDEDYRGHKVKGTVMDYNDEIPRDNKATTGGGTGTPPPASKSLSGPVGKSSRK